MKMITFFLFALFCSSCFSFLDNEVNGEGAQIFINGKVITGAQAEMIRKYKEHVYIKPDYSLLLWLVNNVKLSIIDDIVEKMFIKEIAKVAKVKDREYLIKISKKLSRKLSFLENQKENLMIDEANYTINFMDQILIFKDNIIPNLISEDRQEVTRLLFKFLENTNRSFQSVINKILKDMEQAQNH